MSVSGTRLKPKVVAPPKVKEEVAVEHNPDKGCPDQHMKAVEACRDVERSAVDPVCEREGCEDVFYSLQGCEVSTESHGDD